CGLDPMQFGDLCVRQHRIAPAHLVEGANALLAAGHAQQLLVDRAAPAPVDAGLHKRLVEGLAMDFLRLRQRAVDLEDQRASACDQFARPADLQSRRRQRHVHATLPGAPGPPENTRLASTSDASIDVTSALVSTRSSRDTSRLAWRSRMRSSALRIE